MPSRIAFAICAHVRMRWSSFRNGAEWASDWYKYSPGSRRISQFCVVAMLGSAWKYVSV